MARIAPIAPEAMSTELKQLLDSRPPYNIYRILANAPTALPGFVQLAGALLTRSELDPQLREMVILRVGYLQRSDYELFHHSELARSFGVTDAEQAAIVSDDLSVLGAAERALIEFASEVIIHVSPSDAALDAMRRHYSDRFLFDMVVLIGSYMLTARLAAVGGVAIEDEPVTGW